MIMYFVVFQILKIETFCQTAPEKKTKELTFGNVGIEDSGIKKCSTQSSDFGYLPRRNVGIEGSGLMLTTLLPCTFVEPGRSIF